MTRDGGNGDTVHSPSARSCEDPPSVVQIDANCTSYWRTGGIYPADSRVSAALPETIPDILHCASICRRVCSKMRELCCHLRPQSGQRLRLGVSGRCCSISASKRRARRAVYHLGIGHEEQVGRLRDQGGQKRERVEQGDREARRRWRGRRIVMLFHCFDKRLLFRMKVSYRRSDSCPSERRRIIKWETPSESHGGVRETPARQHSLRATHAPSMQLYVA